MTRQAGINHYSIVQAAGGAPRPGLDDLGWSIGVAHRDELIRTGLESLASGLGQVRELASHADWPDLAERLRPESRPDVLIVEHGIIRDDESRMAMAKNAKTRIILLLETAENKELSAAASLAPDGFLVERGLTASILATAVRQTMSGLIPMAPQVASGMLAELNSPTRISVLGLNQLTPREQETLRLLVEGCSNKQIASRLGISINGAKRHVANVLAKLNCPNRTLAAAEAVRLGVV